MKTIYDNIKIDDIRRLLERHIIRKYGVITNEDRELLDREIGLIIEERVFGGKENGSNQFW
jgi:hypothetical protein